MRLALGSLVVVVMAAAAGCGKDSAAIDGHPGGSDANPVDSTGGHDGPLGDVFDVTFTTSKGTFVVEVHRPWSPNGVDRFAELVTAKFYDDARFFRVISGFVVQFGINGTPATNAMWANNTIPDDPVVQSNTRGYVTFAQTSAVNSRTTQLFVNLGNNASLDAMRFAPFGIVTTGMDVVDALDAEYGEAPDQSQISSQGNAYLTANFPHLDFITTARIQ